MMAGEIGEVVRKAIADVGTDVRAFVIKTTDTVGDATEEALRGAEDVVAKLEDLTAEVTSVAIKAVDETGIDDSTVIVNSIDGTIRGARRLGHSGGDVVKQSARGAIRGALEAKGDLGQVARSAVVGSVIGTRDMALSAKDAAADATTGIFLALRKEKPDIKQISRDTLSGAIGGVARSNGQLAGVISSVTKANITTAMMIGEDPVVAAKESVQAAIDRARDLGISAEELAGAAATGALEASREIGGGTARDILVAITGTISGVRVMASEPLGKPQYEARPG
jgi:hypothetical protein